MKGKEEILVFFNRTLSFAPCEHYKNCLPLGQQWWRQQKHQGRLVEVCKQHQFVPLLRELHLCFGKRLLDIGGGGKVNYWRGRKEKNKTKNKNKTKIKTKKVGKI